MCSTDEIESGRAFRQKFPGWCGGAPLLGQAAWGGMAQWLRGAGQAPEGWYAGRPFA